MTILAQDFPFNSVNKQMMTKQLNVSQLKDNLLFLEGYLPGDVIVVNSQNKVVNIPQIQHYSVGTCIGVDLDFTGYKNLDGWKIRFFNVQNISSTINIDNNNLQELMKLSLIFN